jgi:deoxycytidylate deaminase
MTNKIFDKVYSKLKDEAINSPILYKHCAAILKYKKIIGKPCCNDYGCAHNDCSLGSVHAEANAIFCFFGKDVRFDQKNKKWTISCKSKLIRKNLDVVVIRINSNGDAANSRPCYNCLKIMQDIEIKYVFYSTDSNRLVCERVKDMISIQSSHVTRTLLCKKHKCKISDYEFSDKILKTNFPNEVKRHNLLLFMKNNNYHNYLIIIINDKVIIKNIQGEIILTSYIV